MRVRVLFFARARELAGAGEAAVELEEGATAATLLEALEVKFPALAGLRGDFVLSLNQEYLAPGEAAPLRAGDEVALIPPISGG